jgi:L-fuculose-phosphate aldolase
MTAPQSPDIAGIIRKAVFECLGMAPPTEVPQSETDALFHSPQAQALKQEMTNAGHKLWSRAYVDGNGGNITARLTSRHVLCTPTLCSKGDLRIEDICMVDLENRQMCGTRLKSSEIKLHLEIYKTVPRAKAVIHCHPPYATAHAVAGLLPQANLVPEQEVFVGLMALAPYERPGTVEFANTVRPLARQHNTILLANHGIVCWADTVTHAEWLVEIAETYCKTVMIASQLRSPLPELSQAKVQELLDIKVALGLPDARLPIDTEHDLENPLGLTGVPVDQAITEDNRANPLNEEYLQEIEMVVSAITAQMESLRKP